MTVICYRDGILAADRLITDGYSVRAGRESKIFKRNSAFYGFSGSRGDIARYCDWLFGPALLDQVPTLTEGISCIRVNAEGVAYGGGKPPVLLKLEAPFLSIGSGSHIALGAMWMGATAEQAVQAAIALDAGCGGPIDVLRCVEETLVAAQQPQQLVGQINPSPIRDPYQEIMGTHFGGPR